MLLKIICKQKRGSVTQGTQVMLRREVKSLTPFQLKLPASSTWEAVPPPPTTSLSTWEDPKNYGPGLTTPGHSSLETAENALFNYTAHLFFPFHFHNICQTDSLGTKVYNLFVNQGKILFNKEFLKCCRNCFKEPQ